jgi:protein-glutamine gamma-glutamyltransferase
MNLPRRSALLLTAASLLAQLPHWPEQTLPLSALWALLFAWQLARQWQASGPLRLRYLLPIAIGMALLIFNEYRSLFGSHAGVAFFTSLCTLKLLETRNLRDARLLLYLNLFNTALHFLVSQTPWMALYSLGVMLFILTCWLQLENNGAPLRALGKTAGRLVLEGLPIAILMFVFFPRLAGPLWAIPSERSARSGLSGDSLDPGSVSQLALDESVAFRVEFTSPLPSQEQLYWRGPIYEIFDGRRWLAAPRTGGNPPVVSGLGNPVHYAITLEPHQQRWLLALDMPERAPERSRLNTRLQLLSDRPISQRERFELSSNLTWKMNEDPLLEGMSRLPERGNPRARALAESWRHLPAEKRVAAGLAYLAANDFGYTLTPPLLQSADPIDEFLFEHRLGFCEHFASSYAWLMRAAGVPARIVGGYQGGAYNTAGQYLIVRQADAHAWVEVWLDGQGWQRVDPTATIAPARIREGLARSLPQQAGNLPLMLREGPHWLKSLRLNADVLLNGWNQWVIAYNLKRQMSILQKLGIDNFLHPSYLAWLAGLFTLVFSALAFHLLKAKAVHRDPASRFYARFVRRMSRKGLAPGLQEPPQAYADRTARAKPDWALSIMHITKLYLAVRYAGKTSDLPALQDAVRRFNP